MKSISISLTETLKDSDLKGLTTEWSEVFLDTFLADGVLKDIPIINSIIGLGKTGIKINETIFLKKILYFISQVNDIPAEEREKVISEIDDSKSYRIKIGEKLLYIIDKCDDHEKAEIIGHFFSKFLLKEIDYDEFLRCSLIIDRCITSELKWFVKEQKIQYDIRFASELFSWGILELAPLNLKIVPNNRGNNSSSALKIDNTDLKLKISPSGNVIRNQLIDYVKRQEKNLKVIEMDSIQVAMHITLLNEKYSKSEHLDRLSQTHQELIIELCNNWNISDEEFNNLASEIITSHYYGYVKVINRFVLKESDLALKVGNDFNDVRWKKFYEDFTKLHKDKIDNSSLRSSIIE